MRKVLLFYGSYGGGHLSAAKSIKEYIEKNYPETEVNLVDCIECTNKICNKITTAAYSWMAKKAPWAWKIVYRSSENGFLSKVSKHINTRLSSKLGKFINEYNPDVIISTHFFSNQMCTILKMKGQLTCKVGTVLTDFHIHSQWLVNSAYMDYYFVSNEDMKKDMCNLGISESKIFVTGIPFSQRFLEVHDRAKIIQELNFTPDKQIALFFAGGKFGLGKRRTFEIYKTLACNFPDIQIIAVAGKNKKMKKMFTDCAMSLNRQDSICVLEYTKSVPEFMSISDFVVTKPGGLTTTESLVSGLPMLIINPIPGHEEQNAEFLERSGVGIWLRKTDDINRTLERFLSSKEQLIHMKENALKLSRKNSVEQICKIMLDK